MMGEAKRRGSRELRIGEAIHREFVATIKRQEEFEMRALVWQKDHEKRLKEAEGKTVIVGTDTYATTRRRTPSRSLMLASIMLATGVGLKR
jgi:hypothetical protein